MTRPASLTREITWAEGQRRQHLRIAARNPADSRARARAQQQAEIAAAAVRALQRLQSLAVQETA